MTTPYDTYKTAILGVPFDPSKKPSRQGAVKAFAEMQLQLEGAQSGALVKDTLANLEALTSVSEASIMAWVTGDSVQANNGIYENTGTNVAPSWTRRADIPQFIVAGVNGGDGTANAIQVTTDLAIPVENARCLIMVPIVVDNTGATTIVFNEGTIKTIKSISGSNVLAGSLLNGMVVTGYISDDEFRLVTDIASASIATQAETARDVSINQAGIATDKADAATLQAVMSLVNAQASQAAAILAGAPFVDPFPIDNITTAATQSPFLFIAPEGVQSWTHSGTYASLMQGPYTSRVDFDDVSAVLAYNGPDLPIGLTITTRKKGFTYTVVASGEHLIAGTTKLIVNPDKNGNLHVAAAGAIGDGNDDRNPIYTMLDAQGDLGGGVVQFEAHKTYGVGRVWISGRRGYLSLPDKVGIDLNGSTLQRLGTNYTDPFIENYNASGRTTGHVLRNGLIKGTGAPGQLSDQGAGALFYNADGVIIENIKTDETNGDGLSFRICDNAVMRDVDIGSFGRNGISPTSGSFVYDNVRVTGTPIAGANPGISIDAENDGATERASHVFIYVEAPDITFVDFHGSSGGTFGHDITMLAGRIGPKFKPLRFLSTNVQVANWISIGSEVEIITGGNNGGAIEIKNLSGGNINGACITRDPTATSIQRGIFPTGTVDNWHINVRCDPTLTNGIEMSTGTMNNCRFSGDLDSVYLTGANNEFYSAIINYLTIVGAGTTGNSFHAGVQIAGITETGGGLVSAQKFSVLGASAELSETATTAGARLKFRAMNRFSAQSLGIIEAFPDNAGYHGYGAAIEFYQPGSVDTGELRFFTSFGGAGRVERIRVSSTGTVQLFNVQTHADDAAASSLAAGTIYKTANGELRIKL